MDFYVYDNITTYNKMHPSRHHYPETDLRIKQVIITHWNSFWIQTEYEREDHNVNINAPYVHLHKGTVNTTKMKFDITPYYIPMQDAIYDPKKKQILIYKPNSFSWNPWRKPLKIKNVKNKYYGSKLPNKKQKASKIWKYDNSTNTIHIILNYYGGVENKYLVED